MDRLQKNYNFCRQLTGAAKISVAGLHQILTDIMAKDPDLESENDTLRKELEKKMATAHAEGDAGHS